MSDDSVIFFVVGVAIGLAIGVLLGIMATTFDEPIPESETLNEQVASFEFPEEIRLWNEVVDLMHSGDEDIIPGAYARVYEMEIKSSKEILCVEHKFDDVDLIDTNEVAVPDEYSVQSYGYDVDCWDIGVSEDYYYLKIEQETKIEDETQNVKFSLLDKE